MNSSIPIFASSLDKNISLETALETWIKQGRTVIGEVQILVDFPHKKFCLCHYQDVLAIKNKNDQIFQIYTHFEDAIEIAKYDKNGEYRPLKGAANLKNHWKLFLPLDYKVLIRALDGFYPGRSSAYLALCKNQLSITSLRETLNRQTGMYRVTQRLTTDQATSLVPRFCHTEAHCLRTILWSIESTDNALSCSTSLSQTPPTTIPLLCQEACNLLIAKAREVVKAS